VSTAGRHLCEYCGLVRAIRDDKVGSDGTSWHYHLDPARVTFFGAVVEGCSWVSQLVIELPAP
jgi:hypothetical protein